MMNLTQLAVPAPEDATAAAVRLSERRRAFAGDPQQAARLAGALFALRVLPLIDRLDELAGEVDALKAELDLDEDRPIEYSLAAPGPMADLRRWTVEAQTYARQRAWQAMRTARGS